jgi:hypothetical protein
MLRDREFSRLSEPVYKVGFSTDFEKRARAYPKNSEIFVVQRVQQENARKAESMLLAALRSQPSIIQRTDIGREYFEGPIAFLQNIFSNVANLFCVGPDEHWVDPRECKDEAVAMEEDVEEEAPATDTPAANTTPKAHEIPKPTKNDTLGWVLLFLEELESENGSLKDRTVSIKDLRDQFAVFVNKNGCSEIPVLTTFLQCIHRLTPAKENFGMLTFTGDRGGKSLKEFLEDRCIFGSNLAVSSVLLLQEFNRENPKIPISAKALAKKMDASGFQKKNKRLNGGDPTPCFAGLDLKSR